MTQVDRIRRFFFLFFVTVPFQFLLWLVFVGTFSRWELLVGAGVSVIGGVAILVVERADDVHFRPRLKDLSQAVFIPWLLIQGAYEVLRVGIRDLLGGRKAVSAFRIVRFEAGALRDVHDTARRVLAVAFTTMAPTSIVLGINTNKKELVFHQIERSGVSRMTKDLGAIA